jgi:hypothetical protein
MADPEIPKQGQGDPTPDAEPQPRHGPLHNFQDDLDEEHRQRERAAAWVRDNWKLPATCAICGSNNWQISDVYEMRRFREGAIVIGGSQPVLPVFPVTCNVCGNTIFINAVVSGVVAPSKAASESPDSPESESEKEK